MTSQVREMFDRIAPRYDLANRVMSAGIDRWWRRRAVALLEPKRGERILDLACGTGDCARQIARMAPDARVVGVDFAREMLRRNEGSVAQGDALALPLPDASMDGAICAFGLRNVPDGTRALAELRRILVPGGRLVVLEFFRGKHLAHGLARALGGLVSGDRMAYEYLAESIGQYQSAQEFVAQVAAAGFAESSARPLFPSAIAHVVKGVRS